MHGPNPAMSHVPHAVGSALLTYGFGAYFTFLPGGDLSSLMLIYGFPMTVLGAALAYAQAGMGWWGPRLCLHD